MVTEPEENAVVSENRQIVFSDKAFLEAVLVQMKKQQVKVPVGMVEGIRPVDGEPVSAVLQLRDLHSGIVHDVDITPQLLAAALIAFCVDHRIPVPRRATKSLLMVKGKVALTLELPARSARLHRREALRMG